MALSYEQFAILPVGMSCQVADQLYRQQPFLDDVIQEEGEARRSPMDWLVAPTRSTTKMVEMNQFFPSRADELARHGDKQFCWTDLDVWYLHSKNADQKFDDNASKYNYMARNLQDIENKPVLALWCNSQRNLNHESMPPDIDVMARQSELDQLERALQQRFGRAALFSVVQSDRIDPSDPMRPDNHFVYDVDAPADDWRGDDKVWQNAFIKAFNSPALARLFDQTP